MTDKTKHTLEWYRLYHQVPIDHIAKLGVNAKTYHAISAGLTVPTGEQMQTIAIALGLRTIAVADICMDSIARTIFERAVEVILMEQNA